MIEENARIVEIEKDFVWVETQRQSTCDACSVNKGCGSAVLATLLGSRRTRIKVLNTLSVAHGDEVVIGLKENALVQGSFAVYAVPLLALLAFALLGEYLNARLQITETEAVSIAFGLAGLASGFAWLRRYTARISKDPSYQPVVLRRTPAPAIPVASAF